MMKSLLFFTLFLLISVISLAQVQKDTIVVAPGEKNIHFYHVLERGENFQVLSQKYGIPLRLIEDQNKQVKLTPYALVKIPIPQDQLIQQNPGNKTKDLVPLYHKVSTGETLFRIGKLYEDISPSFLKEWNRLSDNNIRVGQYLVIGWLKLNKTKPAPEREVAPAIAVQNPGSATAPQLQQKAEGADNDAESNAFLEEVIRSERSRTARTKVSAKIASKETTLPAPATPRKSPEETQPGKEETPTVREVASQPQPARLPKEKTTQETATPQKAENKVAVNDIKKTPDTFENLLNQIQDQDKPEEKREEQSAKTGSATSPTDTGPEESPKEDKDTTQLQLANDSQFEEIFEAQSQDGKLTESKKGAAGWFKSNITPGSKKYYALCNGLPRGTIIKVVNPINQRFVYAKVLSSIPQNKEDYNLIVKLSDAAREDLEVEEQNFWSQIVFPKTN